MKQAEPQQRRRSEWAFMEKFEIPYFDEPEVNYLTRWRVVQTPWLSLYLHRMDRPDSWPTLHDHPWSFISLVLRGGYDEWRLEKRDMSVTKRRIRRINVMRRDDAHSISHLRRTPTWTLLLVGKRRRTWGYLRLSPLPGSWTWTEFTEDEHDREFQAAMAQRRASRR